MKCAHKCVRDDKHYNDRQSFKIFAHHGEYMPAEKMHEIRDKTKTQCAAKEKPEDVGNKRHMKESREYNERLIGDGGEGDEQHHREYTALKQRADGTEPIMQLITGQKCRAEFFEKKCAYEVARNTA